MCKPYNTAGQTTVELTLKVVGKMLFRQTIVYLAVVGQFLPFTFSHFILFETVAVCVDLFFLFQIFF